MTNEQLALLDLIRHFKAPDVTELEAALNVITNHAARIRELSTEVDRLKRAIREHGLEGI